MRRLLLYNGKKRSATNPYGEKHETNSRNRLIGIYCFSCLTIISNNLLLRTIVSMTDCHYLPPRVRRSLGKVTPYSE